MKGLARCALVERMRPAGCGSFVGAHAETAHRAIKLICLWISQAAGSADQRTSRFRA